VLQFISRLFNCRVCYFLFPEKKSNSAGWLTGDENSRKERQQPVPFIVPGLSFIATVASASVFYACSVPG
jgi:hypothetical protein